MEEIAEKIDFESGIGSGKVDDSVCPVTIRFLLSIFVGPM